MDILHNELKQASTAEMKAHALFQLAEYYSTRDTIYTRHYLSELRRIIFSEKVYGMAAKAHLVEGVMYYYCDLYNNAELSFRHAEGALRLNPDSLTLARLWIYKGNMFGLQSEYDSALFYYHCSYDIFTDIDDTKGRGDALFAIGYTHLERNNITYAKEYQQKALDIRLNSNDSAGYANSLIGMSRIYEKEDSIREALLFLKKALEIRELVGDERRVASSNMGLGEFLIKHGNPDIAIIHLSEAKEVFSSLNERSGIAMIHILLSRANILLDDYDNALFNLEKACDMAENINNPALSVKCLKIRSEYHSAIKEQEKALLFYKQYTALKDSLNNIEKDKIISTLEVKYFTEQKNAQIQKLQDQEKLSNQRMIILIISVFLVVAVLVFFIFLYRQKNLRLDYKNRLLKSENEIHAQKMAMQERQKKEMQERLEYQEKELASKALSIFKTSSLVEETVNQLDTLCSEKQSDDQVPREINGISSNLKNFARQDLWEDFEHSFTKVHNDFYKNLLNDAPDLTASEIRIASLIRLNLTTKEICAITMRSESSIKSIRFRLRKKLGLTGEDNLTAYIMRI